MNKRSKVIVNSIGEGLSAEINELYAAEEGWRLVSVCVHPNKSFYAFLEWEEPLKFEPVLQPSISMEPMPEPIFVSPPIVSPPMFAPILNIDWNSKK